MGGPSILDRHVPQPCALSPGESQQSAAPSVTDAGSAASGRVSGQHEAIVQPCGPGLTIGEFAQLTHLSIRTLRRYHEGGLLTPDTVDPVSGYRYYTSERIPAAQVIQRLRELGMPLREVSDILATPDPDARASLVSAHLRRLEAELDPDQGRCVVAAAAPRVRNPLPLPVELRTTPATTVAAVRARSTRDDVLRVVRRRHGRPRHGTHWTGTDRTAGRCVRQRTVHPRARRDGGLPSGR